MQSMCSESKRGCRNFETSCQLFSCVTCLIDCSPALQVGMTRPILKVVFLLFDRHQAADECISRPVDQHSPNFSIRTSNVASLCARMTFKVSFSLVAFRMCMLIHPSFAAMELPDTVSATVTARNLESRTSLCLLSVMHRVPGCMPQTCAHTHTPTEVVHRRLSDGRCTLVSAGARSSSNHSFIRLLVQSDKPTRAS